MSIHMDTVKIAQKGGGSVFQIIVTADIVSAVFLTVILVAVYNSTSKDMLRKTKLFRLCLWICLAGLISDAASYILLSEGYGPDLVAAVFTYLAYGFIEILPAFFSYYLYSFLKEKDPATPRTFPAYISVLCAIDIIFITVGTVTGALFSVKNGVVSYGVFLKYIGIIPAICILSMLVLLLSRAKYIGLMDFLAIGSYIIIPVAALIANFINKELAFSYVACAVSLCIIFVITQSGLLTEARVRSEIYNSLSKIDTLTGMQNRRAYKEFISELSEDEKICVIFCDVNNLKCTNDLEGHDAGDVLICRVADILKEALPGAHIFRIGGDEFLILLIGETQESFSEKIAALHTLIMDNDHIASFGFNDGTLITLGETINSAEHMMNRNKERYYEQMGLRRRT